MSYLDNRFFPLRRQAHIPFFPLREQAHDPLEERKNYPSKSACLTRSSTLATNILQMNFLLMGTQCFHDVRNRGACFLYLLVLLAFCQRQQNQPSATCKRRLRKQLCHLNKPQVSKVLMRVLLLVHGSKTIHSCIEVSMIFVSFAEGKTK